jgi:hypothetical protein
VELANGAQNYELVFAGSARFFGETQDVQIMLTARADALIGTRLLNRYDLAIDFPGGQINRRPRSKPGGKRKRASGR